MYRKHFGIRKTPFSIAPDPRYLLMSEQHREALAHLLYGIKSDGGFILLTGEVGTGKTTLCRCLLYLLPKSCVVAFIINPKLSSADLLAAICDEFRIRYPKTKLSIKILVDLINAYLLDVHANKRRAILIIDEAQNLSQDVLEQIRLLTNLETDERKLLQVILIGQPELREKLALPQMQQLAQRIVARYHLIPLSRSDVFLYVKHRLKVSGVRQPLFSRRSLVALYKISGGVPRIINTICDRALLGAYAQGKDRVERATMVKAAGEVLGWPQSRWRLYRRVTVWAAAVLIVAAASIWFFRQTPFVSNRLRPLVDAVSSKIFASEQKKPRQVGAEAIKTRVGGPLPPVQKEAIADSTPNPAKTGQEMNTTDGSHPEKRIPVPLPPGHETPGGG